MAHYIVHVLYSKTGTTTLQRTLGIGSFLRYNREMNRPRIKAEIIFSRLVHGILERAPWLEHFLGGARRVVNARRLKREWYG
jgi:hypothetical protein